MAGHYTSFVSKCRVGCTRTGVVFVIESRAMKSLPALAVLCCLPCAAQVKHSEWETATVDKITYAQDEKVVPRRHHVKRPGCQGGIGCWEWIEDEPLRIPLTVILYTLETPRMTYSVRQITNKNGTPLNITLHGKTQIATEGMTAHVLDDSGKDVKLPIVEKVAK